MHTKGLSTKAKVLGSVFLVFQILFAINNYGPQNVPGLNLFFHQPWIGENHNESMASSLEHKNSFNLQDITKQAGLDSFVRPPVNNDKPRYLEVMGGGVAVGDYNGDGWEDLFFTSMPSFEKDQAAPPSTLFRNQKDGTFQDVTNRVGLSDIKGYPQGALFFDYDNNGTQDLYVASYKGGQLFKNKNGQFVDVTDSARLDMEGRCGSMPCFGAGATAADYNRDGFLDLLVVNNVAWDLNEPAHQGEHRLFPAFFDPQPSILFENNGDGTFSGVTEKSGLHNKEGKGLSAVWMDVNSDNWPDVYITNDLSHNKLYINNKDGTFTNLAPSMNVDEIKSSMGITASDFDNDGDEDLAITNLKGSKVSLFEKQDGYRFNYATDYSGLTVSKKTSGWGIQFIDLDLDGFQDLVVSSGPVWEKEPEHVHNLFFRNLGNGRFEDISNNVSGSLEPAVSRGFAYLDANHSGTPDLVFANIDGSSPQLFRNNSVVATENNWLKLNLEGTTSNRDAIGARVIIKRADGIEQMQTVKAGSSYQSSSSKSLFFGLGNSQVAWVAIDWPSGKKDTLRDVPVKRMLKIREDVGWNEIAAGIDLQNSPTKN